MELWDEPHVRSLLIALNRAARGAFLVGGAVRDRVMGRGHRNELDLAVDGDACVLAERAARTAGHGVAFVPLDCGRGQARLVCGRFPEAITIDVSSFRRPTIAEDLRARDFTINALAIELDDLLAGRSPHLLDPTDGLGDIESGVVRACFSGTFIEDPLRILRAFRFNAELGFRIHDETLELIPATVPVLAGVAGERIRDELVAILSAGHSIESLREMDRLGVLDALFPDLAPMRGLDQNPHHHLDVWCHTLEAVNQLEVLVEHAADRFGDLADTMLAYLNEEPVNGRPKAALLKLALLFHDAGKPHTMSVDLAGRVRFFGHEKVSLEIFRKAGERLRLSGREMRLVGDLVAGHMRPMIFTLDRPTPRAVFRLHRRFGGDTMGLALIFLADLAASRGPARPPGTYHHAFQYAVSALRACFEREREPVHPLLTGRDLIERFGLRPGPLVGGILKKLAVLQATGEITTTEQAAEMVRDYLKTGNRERGG